MIMAKDMEQAYQNAVKSKQEGNALYGF